MNSAMTINEKPILTVGEVRELLGGIDKSTLSRWIRNGLIAKIPGTNKITRAEYERFITEQSRPKTAADRVRGRYGRGK